MLNLAPVVVLLPRTIRGELRETWIEVRREGESVGPCIALVGVVG